MPDNPHSQHRERLRERCRVAGLDTFQPHEVLELLLTYAIPRKDVNPLAHDLIEKFGSLAGTLNARYNELLEVKGIGPSTARYICALAELLRFYTEDWRNSRNISLRAHMHVAEYLHNVFMQDNRELICMLCLDMQGHVIYYPTVYFGALAPGCISTRKVVHTALQLNTHDVILAHSIPISGAKVEPTELDTRLAEQLTSAFSTMGIAVLDYMIINPSHYLCFSTCDLMPHVEANNASLAYQYYKININDKDVRRVRPIPTYSYADDDDVGNMAAESNDLLPPHAEKSDD